MFYPVSDSLTVTLLSHKTNLHYRRPLFEFTMATRKRVILTLDRKVKVIGQHEKSIGSRQLAAEFGVGKTQINNIVTAKAVILKLWMTV